jgi:hypothetical protein
MTENIIFIGLTAIPVAMLAIWWLVTKISALISKRLLPYTLPVFWFSSLVGGGISHLIAGKFVLGMGFGMGFGALIIMLFSGVLKQKWVIGCVSGLIIALTALAFHGGLLVFVLLLLSGIFMGVVWQLFEVKKRNRALQRL